MRDTCERCGPVQPDFLKATPGTKTSVYLHSESLVPHERRGTAITGSRRRRRAGPLIKATLSDEVMLSLRGREDSIAPSTLLFKFCALLTKRL